jgi:hypothetical protein
VVLPLLFGGKGSIILKEGTWINADHYRPISAYGAIDLPTYYIDVTPFVPLLADGNPHQFTIDVVSAEPDHAILQNWYVSGSLQVLTDSSLEPTTGKITSYNVSPFPVTSNTAKTEGDSVNITVTATRKIHIEADIVTGSGKKVHALWTQGLSYQNEQDYLSNATVQVILSTRWSLSSPLTLKCSSCVSQPRACPPVSTMASQW